MAVERSLRFRQSLRPKLLAGFISLIHPLALATATTAGRRSCFVAFSYLIPVVIQLQIRVASQLRFKPFG
eukprot:4973972-Pleurochrysis_carterae.AAC.1